MVAYRRAPEEARLHTGGLARSAGAPHPSSRRTDETELRSLEQDASASQVDVAPDQARHFVPHVLGLGRLLVHCAVRCPSLETLETWRVAGACRRWYDGAIHELGITL